MKHLIRATVIGLAASLLVACGGTDTFNGTSPEAYKESAAEVMKDLDAAALAQFKADEKYLRSNAIRFDKKAADFVMEVAHGKTHAEFTAHVKAFREDLDAKIKAENEAKEAEIKAKKARIQRLNADYNAKMAVYINCRVDCGPEPKWGDEIKE